MKRIIIHWTGGPNKATDLDKEHYHEIVEGDTTIVMGKWPINANKSPIKNKNYAAHTANCNSDSIGISMAAMVGAIEGKTNGKAPFNERQFEKLCERVAVLCHQFNIPITNTTVLTHAEVQTNLDIKQKGKWDITVIPFKPELKGAKVCGDYIRQCVLWYYNSHYAPTQKPLLTTEPKKPVDDVVKSVTTNVTSKPVEKISFWQTIANLFTRKVR